MDKQAVRHRFNRAAGSYDSVAELQRRVADLLFATLPAKSPSHIIDAGAGTGHGSRALQQRWPTSAILAIDFAQAMLRVAGGGICADIEHLPLADTCTDLYWSNLAFQWCNATAAMAEASRVLKPAGFLAISTLGPGTLDELRQAFSGLDGFQHVLDFEPASRLEAACAAANFVDISIFAQTIQFHHPDLRASLQALKALGASHVGGPRRPGLLGRKAWQTVEVRHEATRTAAGLPSTYEVILCTARKPTF